MCYDRDLNGFSLQDSLAKQFLKETGIICIHKVTRSGCTVSLVKACCESDKKVVVIYPTKRIAKEIKTKIPQVLRRIPKMAIIGPNIELCKKLDPKLDLKFQFKKNCSNCEFRGKSEECVFQNLLANEFDVYCLTYDKLKALQKSMSKETEMLLEKLRNCDVFIFDEFTTAVIQDVLTIFLVTIDENGKPAKLSSHLTRSFADEFQQFDKILREGLYARSAKMKMESDFWITIELFLGQFENVKENGVYKNKAVEGFSEDELKRLFNYGWNRITQLTVAGRDTSKLQEVFLISIAREIIVTCENGTVKVTPRLEDALGYIREFCQGLSEEKLIFAVDSYLPSVNFDKLFGRPVKHKLWGENGDPLGTNRQQLVICDTAHWGALDFLKDKKLQEKVRSFIKMVLEAFTPNQVLVVTTNTTMAGVVKQWNLPRGPRVTYFRSDWMRGVSVEDRRIMICVGGPYIPKKAYDASAKSFRIESFAADLELLEEDTQQLAISRILRLDDTRSEFINSIGRVKDPEAKERSIIFTLGMQSHEVSVLMKQKGSVSKPHVVRPYAKGGLGKDGLLIAQLWQRKENVEVKDIPIVARIIRYAKDKKAVSASQVIPHKTRLVVEKAKQYEGILQKYGVRIVAKRGGVSLEAC